MGTDELMLMTQMAILQHSSNSVSHIVFAQSVYTNDHKIRITFFNAILFANESTLSVCITTQDLFSAQTNGKSTVQMWEKMRLASVSECVCVLECSKHSH